VVIQELRAAMSRPVKSSHTLLKKVAFPSRLETRIITGAVLARFREFSSLSRSAISLKFRCFEELACQRVRPSAKTRPTRCSGVLNEGRS